ncbi:DUF2852 domain-containing protein [Pseudoroseicyclus sp. CXY001]|uniref:DUF2852 domain-containing protein n=1 Tax=Pseudoroseicyclus sp. CXY001 TaxID=3242492 RepID=UPI00358DA4A2
MEDRMYKDWTQDPDGSASGPYTRPSRRERRDKARALAREAKTFAKDAKREMRRAAKAARRNAKAEYRDWREERRTAPHRYFQESHDMPRSNRSPEAEGAFPLKVLSLIFFSAFALIATILAFVAFWPAGLALAMVIAWKMGQGGFFGPHRELSLKVLSLIFFTGYGIVTTAVAFSMETWAGLAIAIVLIWQGFQTLDFGGAPADVADVAPEAEPGPRPRPSGNASFDAYRDDMMRRLEDEQRSFEDFLGRLRAAKDQSEFDDFMEARAARAAANRRAAASPLAIAAFRRPEPPQTPQTPHMRDGEVIEVPPVPAAPRVALMSEIEEAEEVSGAAGPISADEPPRDALQPRDAGSDADWQAGSAQRA